MTQRPGHLTTIVVEKETLRELKHIARKDETYNDLIKELIDLRLQQQNVNNENSEEGLRTGNPAPTSRVSKV
jgi:predicted DNA-binding ribbon-helix-helix protein